MVYIALMADDDDYYSGGESSLYVMYVLYVYIVRAQGR